MAEENGAAGESSSVDAINPAAAQGFERGAADYESARPSYPADAIELISRVASIGPGTRVLDLAAGTGKLTRLLVPTGADVVAVEPVAAMRATLEEQCPGVEALDGTAEAIPLPDSSVDALTVAQAYHWFDPAPALAEMHRVLRPGGTLVLVWNVRDERVDWVKQFTEIIVAGSGGRPYTPFHWAPDPSTGIEVVTDHHAHDIAESGLFSAVEHAEFDNPQPTTPEGVVDRAASTSFVSALPDDRRQALLDEVRAMIESHPLTAGKTSFDYPHLTTVSWCHAR